jgi:hypothetical protein
VFVHEEPHAVPPFVQEHLPALHVWSAPQAV